MSGIVNSITFAQDTAARQMPPTESHVLLGKTFYQTSEWESLGALSRASNFPPSRKLSSSRRLSKVSNCHSLKVTNLSNWESEFVLMRLNASSCPGVRHELDRLPFFLRSRSHKRVRPGTQDVAYSGQTEFSATRTFHRFRPASPSPRYARNSTRSAALLPPTIFRVRPSFSLRILCKRALYHFCDTLAYFMFATKDPQPIGKCFQR
jgi:hypothetical protein